MFKFLKEKIKDWTKNLAKKAEEAEPEAKEEKEIGIDLKKLKKISDKTKREVHFEPRLDKQLRGETLRKGLKNLEEEGSEEEEEKPGTKSFFQRITSRINKVKISEKEFEVYQEELEMLLLENNVALEVVDKIVRELRQKIVGKEFLKKEIESEIRFTLGDIIRNILIIPPNLIEGIKEKNILNKEPYVILFCGINGSGKTTTIAKIAESLKQKGISCVLAAGDTFRAASIEQLKEHGRRIGVNVIAHEYGSDPASVGFDAINYAKKNSINCVLIDTAGRMHTQKNLLKEMEKIVRVCKPDKKLFVGESITGNDAIEQVKSFEEAIGIDGIVLTKADIDEKGGTALSVGYVTKKPIFYLGTGQAYDKIEPFDKEKFIEKLGL